MPNFLATTIFGESISDSEYQFYIEPKSVSKFFKEIQERAIPDYQRPYSWTRRNTLTLLEDVFRNSQDSKNWFLGTIYTTKQRNNSPSSQILDGQQRLTTIQLILKEFSHFRILNEELDWTEVSEDVINRFNDLIEECRRCLYSSPNGEVVQRFKAEELTNNTLKSYIMETRGIKNKRPLETKLEQINSTLRGLASESKTASTLERNISDIRVYLLENVYETGVEVEQKIVNLTQFIDTLLNRFWLIEVPLRNADLSLEIFEAINNRGKPLDLLDRLQFRSLIQLHEEAAHIKQKWKELYIGVEDLLSTGNTISFKDHTSFYKTFFLGLSGEEYSDNDALIEYFSNNYLQSRENLDEFFTKANRVILLFKGIQNPVVDSEFVKRFNVDERVKVVSLLQVVRRTIEESKNTNQLLVSIACTYDYNTGQQYPTITSIWNIVRLVFLKGVIFNEKSQSIRADFNRLIKKSNNDSNIYTRLFVELMKSEEENTQLFSLSGLLRKESGRLTVNVKSYLDDPNKAILRSSSNSTAKLVQYYIAHLTNHKSLGNFSSSQYNHEELEHVFPRAYSPNWLDKVYLKDDIVSYVEELQAQNIFRTNLEGLINELKLAEDLELVPYTTTPHSTPNRLIEWHGNKHVLSLTNNRRISNKSYQDKLEMIAQDASNLVIPGKNTEFGISELDWDYKAIINRSLKILDFISFEVFNRNWDEVD